MSDLNGGPKEVNTLDDVAQAAVSHGLTQWQKMVQERDSFRQEADRLRQEVAHYKIAVEAQSSQLAAMESRVTEMSLVRDEAVRQAAEVRTVLHNIVAIGQPYLHSQLPVTPEKEPEDDWEARQEAEAVASEHAGALRQRNAAGYGAADRPGARRAVPDALAGEGGLRVQSALDR